MPIRKPYPALTTPKYPRRRVERRIKMPQHPDRPLKLQTRSLVRREYLQTNPWWYTQHRRGIPRARVGLNPLEARATPEGLVRGTLPERIVHRYLIQVMKFSPGVDFDFQSSLQGGRMELGGIVADFIFELLRIVIQVQGPTHSEYLRERKDMEQKLALEEMGYEVYFVDMDTIYNEYALDDYMKRIFGWFHGGGSGGGSGGNGAADQDGTTSNDSRVLNEMYVIIQDMIGFTDGIFR